MYDFHYDYIKTNFSNQTKLLYIDTDGLIYEFTDIDIYDNMKNNIHLFAA